METNGFNIPMGIPNENYIIPDENFQVSFDQRSYFDQNHQIMPEFHMLSTIQNEPINVPRITNPIEHLGSNFLSNDQINTPLSDSALASLLATRFGQHGQHQSLNCHPLSQSLEIPKSVVSNNYFPNIFGYNTDPNGWIPGDNNPSVNSDNNELSLGLATCNLSSHEQASSCNSKNLPLGFDSNVNMPIEVLRCSSGSNGYLHVMQEMLTELASYSLGNLDQMNFKQINFDEFSDGINKFDHRFDPVLKSYGIEEKKKHLLSLLEMIDERYNQCLDQIHTAISAFHAVTELDPQIHSCFALHTLTFFYKKLRAKISNHILSMGPDYNTLDHKEDELSSFVPKRWALEQLRRKDHQLWRPQRGLPEQSVSVLRAWMFQNFLHPYPKDAEKQVLAVKSGLTRSQVSNWFINARVRLWKPMIEEMYLEMNRRRICDEETASNHRNQQYHI